MKRRTPLLGVLCLALCLALSADVLHARKGRFFHWRSSLDFLKRTEGLPKTMLCAVSGVRLYIFYAVTHPNIAPPTVGGANPYHLAGHPEDGQDGLPKADMDPALCPNLAWFPPPVVKNAKGEERTIWFDEIAYIDLRNKKVELRNGFRADLVEFDPFSKNVSVECLQRKTVVEDDGWGERTYKVVQERVPIEQIDLANLSMVFPREFVRRVPGMRRASFRPVKKKPWLFDVHYR